MGSLAGVGAAIGSAWVQDGPLGNSSNTAKNLALIVEGGIAVYAIENPVTSACVLLGLALVPVAGFIYEQAPILAAGPRGPGMGPGGPPNMPAMQAPGTMSALHQANIRAVRRADEKISALYGTTNIRALHQGMGRMQASQNLHGLQGLQRTR